MNLKTKLFTVILFVCATNLISAQSSVLATGNWYKIAVSKEGIYCITFNDLAGIGLSPATIDPRNISLYGNKTGILPVDNSIPHSDDLLQFKILVKGESDGTFDPADSIFFYSPSSVQRKINSTGLFFHNANIYSDSVYYFLTVGNSAGLRISTRQSMSSYNDSISKYTDFEWHEMDSINFLHSGKQWFGEVIHPQSVLQINLDLNHISTNDSVVISSQYIYRSLNSSGDLSVIYNNIPTTHTNPGTGSSSIDNFANLFSSTIRYSVGANNGIGFFLVSSDTAATAWLDYVECNFTRDLYLYKPQQVFCDLHSANPGHVTKYIISNGNPGEFIWDVTDPMNVENQNYNLNNSEITFAYTNDSARTYVAFDGNNYLHPVFPGAIPNQDLHSVQQANMIIITPEAYKSEAMTLANFHQSHDALNTIVATTENIYNEYSSGAQDLTAIRDFIRQVYDRSAVAGDSLRFVLLFGDASYDYRNRLGHSMNCIPLYESDGSMNPTQTFFSDNFLAALSPTATDRFSDPMDVAIGRIPVRNSSQANVIQKIMHYESSSTLGTWRKKVVFVADDEDSNTHVRQSDTLSNRFENYSCDFNIDKIYIDSYVEITDTAGEHYPQVNADLDSAILNGSLFINYIGHGNVRQWASENILSDSDVNQFHNNNLPLFLAATAKTNLFDDPEVISLGESIVMNDSGGGIASMSVGREAFSSSNFNLDQKLIEHITDKINHNYITMGELFRRTKEFLLNDPYVASFCLLGDPAVKLIRPDYDVVTTLFNGHPVNGSIDTLNPFQNFHIAGELHDPAGNIVTGFNGQNIVNMFNSARLHYTLANDPQSTVEPFYEWDDTLMSFSVNVNAGLFDTTIVLPANVDSGFVTGKISYYASDGNQDASGCYENFVYDNLFQKVNEIPEIIVAVFPNPVANKIIVMLDADVKKKTKFYLYDITGKIIVERDLIISKNIIDRINISSGAYMYVVRGEHGENLKCGKLLFE